MVNGLVMIDESFSAARMKNPGQRTGHGRNVSPQPSEMLVFWMPRACPGEVHARGYQGEEEKSTGFFASV
jgi:hypothetical protein